MTDIEKLDPRTILSEEVRGILPSLRLDETCDRFGRSLHMFMSGALGAKNVVIKSFTGKSKQSADHEVSMIETLKNIGVPTLNPRSLIFGIIGNYLVTDYEPDLRPLNQEPLLSWPKDRLLGLASQIGQIAGRLHSNGIVHGDLQFRNLFLRPGEPEEPLEVVGVLDLESADVFLNPSDAFKVFCLADLASVDYSARDSMGGFIGSWFGEAVIDRYNETA